MKKIFENIYLFSKLTTSLILFIVIIVMGYFFYTSYQNQFQISLEKKSQESKFQEDINNNSAQIKNISANLKSNKILLSQIEKLIKENKLDNNIKKNDELNTVFEDIQIKIKNLSDAVKSIRLEINQIDNLKTSVEENKINLYDKSIKDLKDLIIIKYENNLDFENELNSLENIITPNKKIFIDKIRVISRKPYKGHYFLEDQFQIEMENYIKSKIEKKANSFLYKIILPYIKIEPNQQSKIISNDSLLLISIKQLNKEKKNSRIT